MSDASSRIEKATALIQPQELHGEVMDRGTRNVWQSIEPISRDDYDALPLPDDWRRMGIGRGAMDEAWFARSPGRDEDGPMEVREIGGRSFGLCARPASAPSHPAGTNGPVRLLVDKHHLLRFARGREIPILIDPEGQRFVHVIEGGAGKAPLNVPTGWTLGSVLLEEDWVLALPHPTTALFFGNGDGYQGPIRVPEGR